jgi:hypothetical protein
LSASPVACWSGAPPIVSARRRAGADRLAGGLVDSSVDGLPMSTHLAVVELLRALTVSAGARGYPMP